MSREVKQELPEPQTRIQRNLLKARKESYDLLFGEKTTQNLAQKALMNVMPSYKMSKEKINKEFENSFISSSDAMNNSRISRTISSFNVSFIQNDKRIPYNYKEKINLSQSIDSGI